MDVKLAWSLNLFMSRFPILITRDLGYSSFLFTMSDYPLDVYSCPHIWRKVSHISLIFIWLSRSTSKIPFLKSSRFKTELTEAQYKPICSSLYLKHLLIPLNCWQNLIVMSVAKGFIQRLVFGCRNILLLYISNKAALLYYIQVLYILLRRENVYQFLWPFE